MISIYHMYWLLNLTKFVTHVPEVVIVFLFIFAYFRFSCGLSQELHRMYMGQAF